MSFRIKKFNIMNHEYNVDYVSATGKTESELGLCEPITAEISVVTKHLKKDLPEKEIVGNLWHEITHAIFYSINEHDMFQNEQLVDNVGNCIAQILMSAEYEEMPNMSKPSRKASSKKQKKRRH